MELGTQKTYFISRSSKDRDFASWLAYEIREDGHKTIVQNEDFGHQAFMNAMHSAVITNPCIIALYSPDYFKSEYCLKEAFFPLNRDPFNKRQLLVPLSLRPGLPPGMLDGIPPTEISDQVCSNDAQATFQIIREALRIDGERRDCSPFPEKVVALYSGQVSLDGSLQETRQKIRELKILDEEYGGLPDGVRNTLLLEILRSRLTG